MKTTIFVAIAIAFLGAVVVTTSIMSSAIPVHALKPTLGSVSGVLGDMSTKAGHDQAYSYFYINGSCNSGHTPFNGIPPFNVTTFTRR